MPLMITREEIEHLASLVRIRLTDDELQSLESDLSSIVEYVSAVKEIAGDEADGEPEVGARYNVFREDKITNEPDQYTEAALKEMPKTHGRFMEVKKILKTDD